MFRKGSPESLRTRCRERLDGRRVPLNILYNPKRSAFSYPTVSNTLRGKRLRIEHTPGARRALRPLPSAKTAARLHNPSCGNCATFAQKVRGEAARTYCKTVLAHTSGVQTLGEGSHARTAVLFAPERCATSDCRGLRDRLGRHDRRVHARRRRRVRRRIRRARRRHRRARLAAALHSPPDCVR